MNGLDDPVMARIHAAQQRAADGDRTGAAADLTALWTEIGAGHGDPLHAVSLAHFLADLQDDPHDELAWDERALAVADGLTDERAREYHASLQVRGFYPSLHLNLAADHLKVARRHLDRAEAGFADLPPGAYADMIIGAVARLRAELGAET